MGEPLASLPEVMRVAAPAIDPGHQIQWAKALLDPMRSSGITTPRRIAAFLAQCSIESAGFRVLEENLHYSAERLCQVWPGRFPTLASALGCARDPEALANFVYGERMGNTAPDDGWRYRGAGLLQLTGKDNYARFAMFTKQPVDDMPNYVRTVAGAAMSAAWFWSDRKLNYFADGWAITSLSQRVNGGAMSAADRIAMSNRALAVFG